MQCTQLALRLNIRQLRGKFCEGTKKFFLLYTNKEERMSETKTLVIKGITVKATLKDDPEAKCPSGHRNYFDQETAKTYCVELPANKEAAKTVAEECTTQKNESRKRKAEALVASPAKRQKNNQGGSAPVAASSFASTVQPNGSTGVPSFLPDIQWEKPSARNEPTTNTNAQAGIMYGFTEKAESKLQALPSEVKREIPKESEYNHEINMSPLEYSKKAIQFIKDLRKIDPDTLSEQHRDIEDLPSSLSNLGLTAYNAWVISDTGRDDGINTDVYTIMGGTRVNKTKEMSKLDDYVPEEHRCESDLACLKIMIDYWLRHRAFAVAAAPTIHNILCAITLNGNTRAVAFTQVKRMLKLPKQYLDKWFVDGGLKKTRAGVAGKRVNQKLKDRFDIHEHWVNSLIGKGMEEFQREPPATKKKKFYFRMLAWLHLVCGSRKTEIAGVAAYESLSDQALINAANRINDPTRFIMQIGVLKKRTSVAKNVPILKPLIGGVKAGVFLKILGRFRAWFHNEYHAVFAKAGKQLVKVIGDKAAAISGAHRDLWKGAVPASVSLPPTFVSHQNRGVYGLTSFIQFAKKKINENFWLSEVLGHEAGDLTTAGYYQGIYVVPYIATSHDAQKHSSQVVAINQAMEKVEAMAKNIQDKLLKLGELEEKLEVAIQDRTMRLTDTAGPKRRGAPGIKMLYTKSGELVRVERVTGTTHEERRANKKRKIDELKRKGIPTVVSNLKAVGAYTAPSRR